MVKSSLHGGVGRAQALNVIKIRVFHHEEHEVHEGVYDGILFFLHRTHVKKELHRRSEIKFVA